MPYRPRVLAPAGLCLLTLTSLSVARSSVAQTASPHRVEAKQMPPRDEAALHAALDAYDAGNTAQAEPALRDLVTRYPESFEANEALGSLYVEGGELARAVPYLKHATALAPRQAIAHANLGAAYLKLTQPAEAVHELQTAAALDARNALTQGNLGQALLLAHEPKGAAGAFAAAAALAPADSVLKYNWGLALFEAGSPQQAADVLDTIPQAERTDQVQALAGDAEEHAGHYERALAHFQAAAQKNPSDANLYTLVAELLRHWTWQEAIEVADFGASRYPADNHFRMAAGIAYYGKSDYTGAVRVFSSLLASDPDNPVIADLLGRSCSLLADGEDAGCGGIYDFAQRHPGNAVSNTYAAVALLHAPKEKQDLDRAESLLRTAIAANPKYAEAYFQLGVLEQSRLRWKESAAALEQSVALRPESAEAHYRLSRAYTHLGRRDEAQTQIALHQTYSDQAKNHLDAKMQEVVRFLLKPS